MSKSETIKSLDVGQECIILNANVKSMRVVVCQLGRKLSRKFRCKDTPEGLIVRRVV